MFMKMLYQDIRDKNVEFFGLLTKALQFNENCFSIIPSILFLLFSMTIIYRITHKNPIRFRRSSYRDALYREIAFQWLYLYVTRAWLYVVKGLRLINTYLEQSVVKANGNNSNVNCIHALMFLIFVLMSVIPFLLTFTIFAQDESLDQNILFWIPPNRWTRNELGSAGRLMERPPDFRFTSSKCAPAYETKRSVSSEISRTPSNVGIIRCCKSGFLPDQVSSLEDLIRNE